MVGNLFVGSLMIVLTVVTHTLGLIVITRSMALMIGWLRLHA